MTTAGEAMEVEAEGSSHGSSEEEANVLRRSKHRNKEGTGGGCDASTMDDATGRGGDVRVSYRNSIIGRGRSTQMYGSGIEEEEEEVSDDDKIEQGSDSSWFYIGMARKEKIEARCPDGIV